jgi:hypothetical protein
VEQPQLVQADTPPAKDGEFARKMFAHLPMVSQLRWALTLKRMKQAAQYRGVLPRLPGRRAQARAMWFPNHAAYARHVHQQKVEAQQRAEQAAAEAGMYAPKPIAQDVHRAFN